MLCVMFLRILSRTCLKLRSTLCKKVGESFLSRGLTPSFPVIFYIIYFSRKMLPKIIDCKSFETSQENVYDGVSFSTVESL